MEFRLELAHLQLTLRCNLRCPFCGQWGAHGFAPEKAQEIFSSEMSTGEWLSAIDKIVEYSSVKSGLLPGFIVWGGEPLLRPDVGEILERVSFRNCRAAIVSNGTLLEERAAELAGRVSTVYISLDGPGELHDVIRNHKGLHSKIERGLAALPREGGPSRTALCVISEANFAKLPETVLYAASIGFDRVIFQNLIYMLPEEAARFDAWLKGPLGLSRSNAASWTYEASPSFASKLPEIYAEMERRIAAKDFPIDVQFHPLGLNSSNILDRMAGSLALPCGPLHCLAPFRHINVGPDGALRFCVDYNELNLGSLKDRPLEELLSSPLAGKFREGVEKGLNPACSRCSWRFKGSYGGI